MFLQVHIEKNARWRINKMEKYGYFPDYINPDKNETQTPDVGFIKWFKNTLAKEKDFPDSMTEEAKEKYHKIKITGKWQMKMTKRYGTARGVEVSAIRNIKQTKKYDISQFIHEINHRNCNEQGI